MLPFLPKTISEWAFFTQTLATVCALMIVAGVSMLGYSWYWISRAHRTEAKIVAFERDEAGNSNPTLRYVDTNGKPHQVTPSVFGGSDAASIGEVGDQVPILYQPDAPGNLRLNRFADKWGIGLLMTILGSFWTGILGWTTRRLKQQIT